MGPRGTVKKFVQDKGFGFIEPEDGGDQVFVHRSVNGDDRSAYLEEGQEVEYEVEYDDRKGKYKATSCTGFKSAAEPNPEIAKKIGTAQVMTVISWCTYPIVYLFPMLGFSAAKAVVSIQLGYCASDIISKCGVGLVIYQISYAKSSKQYLLQ